MDIPFGPQGPQIEIVGEMVAGGVECPLMRASDGTLYSIVDLPRGVEVSDRVRITGHIMNMSYCMQGKTIRAGTADLLQRSGSGKPALTGR